METKEILSKLSTTVGLSGNEHEVASFISDLFKGLVDEVRCDNLGNLIMLKKGSDSDNSPKVMFAAHMDQIGLMVTRIDEPGFLRVSPVGGVDQRILPSMEVTVHGKRELYGVISSVPPHLSDPKDRDKAWKMKDLFVDCGMSFEDLKDLVEVGDLISFNAEFFELAGSRVAGKAMDNRAGVITLYECAKELAKIRHKCDVYLVATVQEEINYGGAFTSTYGIMPDIGVAVDVTHADGPDLPKDQVMQMDGGPAIGVGPHVHPLVHRALVNVARESFIPYQEEPSASPQGTDAYAIQMTGPGVATGLVSIPLRYMHTTVETLSTDDIVKSGKLLAHFAHYVDSQFKEELTCL